MVRQCSESALEDNKQISTLPHRLIASKRQNIVECDVTIKLRVEMRTPTALRLTSLHQPYSGQCTVQTPTCLAAGFTVILYNENIKHCARM